MEKPAPSDPELLADWLGRHREPAFHALVARYAGLVHATAKRTCGDDSMAAEASQLTFIALAQKAKSLTSCASLGGWLHITAMMQAKNLLRKSRRETRKRQLLQIAMEDVSAQPSTDLWQEMQPVLDNALASLSDKDREALLLRFYRSLTIRETAATLGIAPDAAQKRIDRATERLRGKLTRRGCQAGGSLSGALLAGFTADAQAALPVSLFASKAIMAEAASSAIFSTNLFTAASMKTTSVAAPLIVLLAAGVWIASQFHSIARLEQQNALLEKRLADGPAVASSPAERAAPVKTALDADRIDWEEVAAQLESGGSGYLSTSRHLEEGLRSMDISRLTAALDEIDQTKLSATARDLLEKTLGGMLMEKNPGVGLTRFLHRCQGDGWDFFLAGHFTEWAKSDPDKAVNWFAERIAAGAFDRKGFEDDIHIPRVLVSEPVYLLLSTDPETAGRILSAVPEGQRLKSMTSIRMTELKEDGHLAWARLVRDNLSKEDHLKTIAWPTMNWSDGDGAPMTLSEVSAYLKRISATPDEVASCIMGVAEEVHGWKKAYEGPVTTEDFDALRAWVSSTAPELVDRATATAIGEISRRQSEIYPQMVRLALYYHQITGNDELLIPLLDPEEVGENKALARSLAGTLSDETRRNEYLDKLK